MKRTFECYIVGGLFVALTVVLYLYKKNTWVFGFGDNTFIVDLLGNISRTGKPMSQIAATIAHWFDTFLAQPASIVCALPLDAPPSTLFNYFKWHPYLVLYLLAPGGWLFGPLGVLCFVTALSFSSLLLAVYCIGRREGCGAFSATLLTLFIASLPVFSYGIQGQLYVDRLVLGLGIWFMYWLHYERANQWLGWALALCTISLSDRYGFMVGALVLGYFVLHPRTFKYPADLRWIGVALFGVLFTVISIKFYVEYVLTEGFLKGITLRGTVDKLLSPSHEMKVFLLLNFVVMGLFACRAWKFYLLGIGLLLPNLMGSIGGAEKTGFSTHYHSMYFPLLAMAVAVGVGRWGVTCRRFQCLLPAVLVCGIVLNMGLWKSGDELSWKKAHVETTALLQVWQDLVSSYDGPAAKRQQQLIALNRAIPRGSKVTSPEMFMPALLDGHEVHLYPVALETTDFIVYQVSRKLDGSVDLLAAFSHLGAADREAQEMCLKQRARQFGFDLENPEIIGEAAIVRRRAPL